MSLESISKLASLTGQARETVAKRLIDLKPTIRGSSKTYESREALPILYGIGSEQDGTLDLTEERARLTFHQANNEKLKEEQLRGSLIPEDAVREYGSGMVAAFRAKMLALSSKLRNRFTSLPKDVIDEIQRLINEALEELGKDGIPTEIRERIRRRLSRNDSSTSPDD